MMPIPLLLDPALATATVEMRQLVPPEVCDLRTVASSGYAPDEVSAALDGISNLEHDWDSYEGHPPQEEVVARARAVIEAIYAASQRRAVDLGVPLVAPGSDNSVAFVWRSRFAPRDVEIVVSPEGVDFVAATRGQVDGGSIASPDDALELLLQRVLRP